MKSPIATVFLAAIIAASPGFAQRAEQAESKGKIATDANAEKELRAASDQFYAALNAMFVGELAPMNAIWSHRDDVTDLGPFGGRLVGWVAVGAEFKKEAGMKLGGHVGCKDVVVHAGSDMGYTVCVEEGQNMSADGKPVVVSFRATNVFRRENGQWKLVHHHTDISAQLEKATGAEVK